MSPILRTLMALAVSALAAAGQTVTLPWPEFEALYRLQLDHEDPERREAERPAEVVFESADYSVRLSGDRARAEVTVTGRRLPGRPRPVPLLDGEVILEGPPRAEGALLLMRGQPQVLPQAEAFRIGLVLLLPVEEDGASLAVDIPLPEALSRSLAVQADEGFDLLDLPGLPTGDPGRVHPRGRSVRIRFADARGLEADRPVEVDLLTELALEQQSVLLRTAFAPRHVGRDPLRLHIPDGFRLVGSSLRAGALAHPEPGRIEIRPGREAAGFDLEFRSDASAGETPMGVRLPRIEGNAGREGAFVIVHPQDGRFTVEADALLRDLPAARLPRALHDRAGDTYHQSEDAGPLRVSLERFDKVASPDVVVDAVEVFVSFSENGDRLTLVRLNVPPVPEARLRVAPGEGARVWHCRVNGADREVFAAGEGGWLIPLAREGASAVEVAWIQPGPALGLHGRLEAALPGLGLAARRLALTVGLPRRVELLSYEGAIHPVEAPEKRAADQMPREFEGRPHRFTRVFFEGPPVPLAFHFREPVQP